MAEPAYAFSLPSIEDELSLDCRIYHPSDLMSRLSSRKAVKGAVVAHPYAPLGGCFDDPVVLSVVETLLDLGFVVGTFNFRGAQGSQGRTSWTGKAEQQDFISVVGFMIHYLAQLNRTEDDDDDTTFESKPQRDSRSTVPGPVQLLLTGYSYGALILSRFPPISTIQNSFETAARGTTGGEIILRARTLATKTLKTIPAAKNEDSHRTRRSDENVSEIPPSPRIDTSTPITLGGSDDEDQRVHSGSKQGSHGHHRHRDRSGSSPNAFLRRSLDAPKKRLLHLRRNSSQKNKQPPSIDSTTHDETAIEGSQSSSLATENSRSPGEVHVRFLLISPVLIPLTHTILPPGAPNLPSPFGIFSSSSSNSKRDDHSQQHTHKAKISDINNKPTPEFLQHPTLAIFGSEDGFTSSRRLEIWAEEQASRSSRSLLQKHENEQEEGMTSGGRVCLFQWEKIDGAGHFWREKGAMRALKRRVITWVSSVK